MNFAEELEEVGTLLQVARNLWKRWKDNFQKW
jgi:hypothetical protein